MKIAFLQLKKGIIFDPVLAFPNFDCAFIVEKDALSVAVGAVFSQKNGKGYLHSVHFAWRCMNSAERRYLERDREAMVFVFTLKKFRLYLLSSRKFEIITDQKVLKCSFQKEYVHNQTTCCLAFYFGIEHQHGVSFQLLKWRCWFSVTSIRGWENLKWI